MIDCVALSDLHGKLPKIDSPFDLMLIVGDAIDLYCQRYVRDTEDWYLGEFVDWVNLLPFKDEQSKVILIAGNHDVGLEKMPQSNKELFLIALRNRSNHRIIYLENELYNFHCNGEQISIFGTFFRSDAASESNDISCAFLEEMATLTGKELRVMFPAEEILQQRRMYRNSLKSSKKKPLIRQ